MKKISLILAVIAVVMVSVIVLCACAPASNPEKAKDALKSHNYSVVVDNNIQPAALKLVGIGGVATVLEATYSDKETSEFLCVLYFETSKAANEAWEAAQDKAEQDSKEKKEESDWVVGKSGKIIYWGTKAAVKAAR